MKIDVHVVIRKTVTYTIETDENLTEDEIRDRAWDGSYDYACANGESVQDVDWEIVEGEDDE